MKRFAETALIGAFALLFGSPLLMLLIVTVTPLTLKELADRLAVANRWLMHFNLQATSLVLEVMPWVLGIAIFFWIFSSSISKE